MAGFELGLGEGWWILPRALERIKRALTQPYGFRQYFERASKYQRFVVGSNFRRRMGPEGQLWPDVSPATPMQRLRPPGAWGPAQQMVDTQSLYSGWVSKRASSVFGKTIRGDEITRVVRAGDDVSTRGEGQTFTMWVKSLSSIRKRDRRFASGLANAGLVPYGWLLQNVGVGGKKWPHYFFSEKDIEVHTDRLKEHVMWILNRNIN